MNEQSLCPKVDFVSVKSLSTFNGSFHLFYVRRARMCRHIVVVGIIVLVAASSASAIGQGQGYLLGSANIVGRIGGPGLSTGGNLAMAGLDQSAVNWPTGSRASQSSGAIVGQGAAAWGIGGMSGVGQLAGASSTQNQTTNPRRRGPSTTNEQSLGIGMTQTGVKLGGGPGGTIAVQGGAIGNIQSSRTHSGVGSQTQGAIVIQGGAVIGGPGASGISHQSAGVISSQYQSY